MTFHRVALLNRGDAAMRFLRAAREVTGPDGAPLEVVALHTDPDRHAHYVRLADDAASLGPARRRAADGGDRLAYLDHDLILSVVRESGCDALWPGWGFVAEDPDFVERLEAQGIVFLGPPAAAMRRLGDKVASKRLAQASGVPLAPWALLGPDAAAWPAAAADVGYPLMVKASTGGGGRGIRRVDGPSDLVASVRTVRAEADAAFGGGELFVERLIGSARHVEVQFLVDADGSATTFGVRDCTVQRRHQKVFEETPSPLLSPVEDTRLTEATVRLVSGVGYRGVGTAEFLYDTSTRTASFCEVNARLQVEHSVTELVWGVDLVRAQIDVALGRPCDRAGAPRGWAVEARLVAEDAERGFAPSPGRVLVHRPPAGPNIRVDAGVRTGSLIPAEYDSLIAKVLAWGPTRERALATLRRALEEYEVVVEDGATNRGVLLALLDRPELSDATATTSWLDDLVAHGAFERPAGERDALVLAAVELARVDRQARVRRFLTGSGTGVARADRSATEPVELELALRGATHRVRVARRDGSQWLVGPEGRELSVEVDRLDDTAVIARIDGRLVRALVHRGRGDVAVDLEGGLHRVVPSGGTVVRSPGPALLVEVTVVVGDRVEVGQRVGTVEAMKTEAPLLAELAGTVERILVEPGTQVAAGQAVVELIPVDDDRPADDIRPGAGAVTWLDERREAVTADAAAVCDALFLGREVGAGDLDRARTALDDLSRSDGTDDAEWAGLARRLRLYVDVEALFERNLLLLDDHSAAVSAEAAFHDACRHHRRGGDGMQPELRPLLQTAVSHVGVDSLEDTEELREALWRLAATRTRAEDRERLVTSLIRAVAALVRRGAIDADQPLVDDLTAVARVAAGSATAVADAAELVRAELVDDGASIALDPSSIDVADLASLARYHDFDLTPVSGVRLPGGQAVVVRAANRSDPTDARTVLVVQVDDTPVDLLTASPADLEPFAQVFASGVRLLRHERDRRRGERDWWAALHVDLRSTRQADERTVMEVAQRHEAVTRGLALQELTVSLAGTELSMRRRGHARLELLPVDTATVTVAPRSELDRRSLTARRLGLVDPWELIGMLEGRVHRGDLPHPSLAVGRFVEHDLDEVGDLVPVDRPPATHTCSVVLGVVANPLPGRSEWAERIWIAGDPVRSMGSLGEPECRRIIAALDLAQERGLPVEWVALSSGARIAMDSGTENLDWTASVLARIVRFTGHGGQIDVIVAGVNVGAQSYWNAEATMLMHTRGVLIMVPGASMVLTGNRALELSGSVGAEDEVGVGGHDRIMGPNGQAQFRAADLAGAYAILMDHHALTHPGHGTMAPSLHSTDPADRDVTAFRYKGAGGFATVGEIFADQTNPGRKRPFDIRAVMGAVVDQDAVASERWRHMADATNAVVWETRVGGHPVTMIGMESRPTPRSGTVPVDGPSEWAGGTLYPSSSKKVARAIRSASGNHPVVVLANLSGFDGSPESLRRLQLEYGAEIARAVVDFDGPIVFVVIGRYHGGAYVVFSKQLQPRLTALAVEGSYASVIGGAPAAAVVLTREVRARVEADTAVVAARRALDEATDGDVRLRCVEELDAARTVATSRCRAEVAAEFDAVHTVDRAVAVGSLDAVVSAPALRPEVISVLDREVGAGQRLT